MRGLKASLIAVTLTAVVCLVMIMTSSPAAPLKKSGTQAVGGQAAEGIVSEEGIFPADMYYQFGENKNIYYVKYDDRSAIKLHDIVSGKSETVLTPINQDSNIHAFCKSGDYFAWEEDRLSMDDEEQSEETSIWKVYVRRGNHIARVDEAKDFSDYKDKKLKDPPQKLCACDNYLVYKTYDISEDSGSPRIVIKLYDMENDRAGIIFSAEYTKNIEISEPAIYKNHVVWSVSNGDKTGDMYLYDIFSDSYSKLTENGTLLNPVIWGDYIACQSDGNSGPAIVVLNFNTGFKKYIAFSDCTLYPKKELHDYTIGEGYITWDSSYADAVSVYDIINDRIFELKRIVQSGNSDNSLLNIRLYGKILVFTDHVFNKKNGSTISEINRYIILK